MAICNSFLKEEDDKLVEAALRGEFSGIQSCSPEIREAWEKATPAAEAALEVRYDQMMEAKNTEFVQKAEEIIERGESTFSEIPQIPKSPEEALELIERAEAVEKAINNLEPVKTTPEERVAMRETGKELGLSSAKYVGTADIVRLPTKESVKEVMAILNHPEMPRCFIKRESIGQIQYVNNPDIPAFTGVVGLTQTTNPDAIMKKIFELEVRGETVPKELFPQEKTLGVYIFPDAKGNVQTGKPLERKIVHEVIGHGNWPKVREYIREHKPEFDQAITKEIERRGLPSYPFHQLVQDVERMVKAETGEEPTLTAKERLDITGKYEYLPETRGTRLLRETVAELAGDYFTDGSQLSFETRGFFSDMLKHFRNY